MVTKQATLAGRDYACYILAKSHMVTKLVKAYDIILHRYILAKNHMVTKPDAYVQYSGNGYILAKNHMVTKPRSMRRIS